MALDCTEYRDRLTTAILTAIVDTSTGSDGETVTIPAREAGEALVLVLAMMITGTEATRTPKALRETADTLAKDLRVQVRRMQEIQQQTGQRPFEAELVMPN